MNKLRSQFMGIFDLSAEVAMDLPLIMMVGDGKICIENHKGISLFQDKEIKIKINNGFIVFKGEELVVGEINSESITISGRILSLIYENRIGSDRS